MRSAYRVAAPSIRFVPWAALASCWPLPQQLLPVSATGGGRRRCTLHIFSGKNIFNRAMPERLRTLRHCIFTGGVVEENGICSAAFCESAALRERLYLVFTTLSVKNAFGALRRARQTLYIKRSFRYICPERKRMAFLIFPLSRWTLKCVILGENDAHRRDDHAI